MPIEQLRPAHYALCASLDDVVLNTPWGSSGGWATRSLVSTFHQEVRSGERFFDLLDADVRQNPGMFLPVLELMYLCLSASASRASTACRRAASASSTGCARRLYAIIVAPAAGGRAGARRRTGRASTRPTGRRAPSCRLG